MNYTYNADGTTATKTDAKGTRTEFSYDAYKRPIEMRKLTEISGVRTEDRFQRVSYDYSVGGSVTRYLQKSLNSSSPRVMILLSR